MTEGGRQVIEKLKSNIVAGQESWERDGSVVSVDGFGKPRNNQKSLRGEGFLVRECLVDEVDFISQVAYEESVWMKVRRGRAREAFYRWQ